MPFALILQVLHAGDYAELVRSGNHDLWFEWAVPDEEDARGLRERLESIRKADWITEEELLWD